MLSTKYLVFKERLVKKLVDWFTGSYIINKVVFINAVKLRLLTSMRTHLVVNISHVVRYKKLVEEQSVEETEPAKVK